MILSNIKKNGKIVSVILICALIVGMTGLAGCQKKEEESPIVITLMHGWGGTLKTHNTMQKIFEKFSEENPDIELKSTPYSDSSIAVEKANDMLAVGRMPDVMSTNGLSYYVYNAVKTDMAMDLMPYIEADQEFLDAIHPTVLDTWGTSDGALYTIPDALEVAGYWYNANYLKEAQVVGEDGEVKLPSTWDEFFEMVEKIKIWTESSGEEVAVCALDPIQISEYIFQARLCGTGANGKESAESTSVVLEEKTIAKVLKDINRLCGAAESVDNIETARQSFSDGKSAIYFNGVWESDVFSESKRKQEFQYAAYPTEDGKSLSYISPSSGYVLAKQTDKRKTEAGIRFLKYMLSERVQTQMAVETGQAPSNPHIDQKEVQRYSPVFANAINAAYEADVQIKTIWSVWPEERLQIVSKFCEMARDTWSEDMGREMTEQLNQIQ